ncbi:iron-containing alcohol dehydrogenase [Extibacter muris]|uniref:Glycerol dehydrogenase n=1 Tax=Extibacter muris TaxID=1796622 RepID=A0A4R4FAV9_9FIRM|nr:iron-containing alcohol dehydrogenase [Extibacter muris]
MTKERIEEAISKARAFQAEAIVGIGGGKAIDTAKCVTSELEVPLIAIPTSASTDAPTIAMAIIYNDRHEHEDVYYFSKNPDMVLIDSSVIAKAPVRFLVSGMGDALATAFEARTTMAMDSNNYICQESGSYRRTRTAEIIAEECLRTIMQNGRLAKLANENGIVTEPLEAVIEANTLMSGLGFENVGCAAAHCICNGLSSLPGGDNALHGEKVAFGVICQLLAEHAPVKEIEEVIQFNLSVGLPVTLKDMGIETNEETYEKIAGDPDRTEWQREPFYTNARIVADIVKCADELGKMYAGRASLDT